jgi:hypothetical protein
MSEQTSETIYNVAQLHGTIREQQAEIKRLRAEIADGDYWQVRATQAIQNGTCPICFATDEAGHKQGCLWGEDADKAERAEAESERLRAIIAFKLHQRRCHDCGYVGWYADSRTPYCLCDNCGSWDTRRRKECQQ